MNPCAVSQTSAGIKISANAVKSASAKASPPIAWLANPIGLSCASRRFENKGTKAALKAPSAKNRRNILGKRNATTNASNTGPAPINIYSKTSRAMPRTRLSKVQKPTVIIPLSSRGPLMLRRAQRRARLLRVACVPAFFAWIGCKISDQTCLLHKNYQQLVRHKWR